MKTHKTCTKCLQTKELEYFAKNKQQADGRACRCKTCIKQDNTASYQKNKEKIKQKTNEYYHKNKETILAENRSFRKQNNEEFRRSRREYYKNNKESFLKKQRECILKNYDSYIEKRRLNREKNKEKINQRKRIRLLNKPLERLASSLRRRLRTKLRNQKAGALAHEYLGCTIGELKSYIESLFLEGMNWENYGSKGWHLDHIKPMCMFDLTKKEDLAIVCHYSNLRPLWAKDNLTRPKKGKKLEKELELLGKK